MNATGPALLTDHYELTMVNAALKDGTADRRCVFEVFGRRLPTGRRYGVVAGTGRLLDLLADFRYAEQEVEFLRERGMVDIVCHRRDLTATIGSLLSMLMPARRRTKAQTEELAAAK